MFFFLVGGFSKPGKTGSHLGGGSSQNPEKREAIWGGGLLKTRKNGKPFGGGSSQNPEKREAILILGGCTRNKEHPVALVFV